MRLGVVAGLIFAVAGPALAQTDRDVTNIVGTVNPICTIDAPNGQSLSVSGAATLTDPLVMQCNSFNGYSAAVISANGGFLTAGSRTTTKIPYTIDFGLGPKTLSGRFDYQVTAPDGISAKRETVTVDVGAPVGNLFAGVYSDIITFTISAL